MSFGLDPSLLQAALEGYDAQLQRLNSQIEHLRQLVSRPGNRPARAQDTDGPELGKRRRRKAVSEEGRKRMAEAQQRRWAAVRLEKGEQ